MDKIISKKDIEKTVTIRNGIEVVRSDNLAKMFGKQHKHILEKINNIMRDLSAEKSANNNFKKYFIFDEAKVQGGTFTRYYLTRKGFDLVGLSLTGKKALQYKIWYIDSFHDQRKVIDDNKLTAHINKQNDIWIQGREEGKLVHTNLTDMIKKYVVNYRLDEEGKQNDGRYYQHYSNLVNSVLGITVPTGVELNRDILTERMLGKLEALEERISKMIIKYAESGMHYKEVYKQIKTQLKG